MAIASQYVRSGRRPPVYPPAYSGVLTLYGSCVTPSLTESASVKSTVDATETISESAAVTKA